MPRNEKEQESQKSRGKISSLYSRSTKEQQKLILEILKNNCAKRGPGSLAALLSRMSCGEILKAMEDLRKAGLLP